MSLQITGGFAGSRSSLRGITSCGICRLSVRFAARFGIATTFQIRTVWVMDYHLKPIGKTCAATGNELVPGSVCHSVLVERGSELVRLDYSDEGWNGPPEESIGHWSCVVPEQDKTKVKPLDTDGLMRYFEQLDEDANPAQEKFRYVLALLLLQKRRLRLEDSRHEADVEYLQLTGSHGEGPFEVRDQQLDKSEIDQLQNNLNSHLMTEWS